MMPNVLTVEERERVRNYAERWIAAGNVEALSSEEQTVLIGMLEEVTSLAPSRLLPHRK
jgi:hypothetical protein